MIRPAHHGIEVWLCVEPVDFRKQSTGLATLVQDRLSMDPFSSQLFVFTNRRRTQCRMPPPFRKCLWMAGVKMSSSSMASSLNLH